MRPTSSRTDLGFDFHSPDHVSHRLKIDSHDTLDSLTGVWIKRARFCIKSFAGFAENIEISKTRALRGGGGGVASARHVAAGIIHLGGKVLVFGFLGVGAGGRGDFDGGIGHLFAQTLFVGGQAA